MPLKFHIVDVFAEKKYAGNQLAVFTEAASLSTEEMQQIAKEMNYSETTFIGSSQERDGGYDVRIFTPAKELPFAGHPTLGTAFILQYAIIQQSVETIVLNLKVGQIPVAMTYRDRSPDILTMKQNPPVFGDVVTAAAIAPVLNLDITDIDSRFPIQEVSTGVPFLIVPLKTLAALKRIKVNVDRLAEVVKSLQAKEVFVFCPETRNPANHFSARMFAPLLGIAEDPATGSANGCFAGYLAQHNYLEFASVDVRVEQGYEIGRPSLLLLKAQKQDDIIEVSVGGNVILVAQGEFV
ncbi:PhzF family phenazine biosynthesis protein [Leptolyngbya sp. FACHB-36]|uniref:PhzF family phenazine biosynthesis protein n=1 Tax=Leptolyngbya sp. FACHB-36 TaxID=2692808 RepID=UPI0016805A36|nr:PhzF family phenazine biosynthesis protein [Leptolyngbya sp. FACHB-36]MBD2022471.1 PhzF family phenazine biosynthesis protein [Leptolyngbya sp. FACHB-36]